MICQIVIYLYFSHIVFAQYSPSPRWAQAVALLENKLYVHGGLSDPFNSYSYSSAPEISDLLLLDLSASFNSSSPPWQLLTTDSSPALAWHTLSAFDPTQLFLFGGQPGPNSQTVLTTLNNSAGLLSTVTNSGPSFLIEPQDWANQPIRRIRHSSSYASGRVWIIGGEEADGSGNAFGDQYAFRPSGPNFVQLPSSPSAPPDIYGHASLVLPDGRLLVLGGYCASCSELVPMSTVWSLDTTQRPYVWEMAPISSNSLPSPRRDFAASVLANGWVLLHGGGDAQLEVTYSDGWILDTSQNPMVWSSVPALTQLGPRKDHFAVQANGLVLFCFGYGLSSPAPASLFIFDPNTSSVVTSYTAPPPGSAPAITSFPMPAQTGSNSNSDGGTGTGTISQGSSSGPPTITSSSSSQSSQHATAIALGTVFGFLGLIACGLATIYYLRRAYSRDQRPPRRFIPLADDPEFSPLEESVYGVAPGSVRLDGQVNQGHSGPSVMTHVFSSLGFGGYNSETRQPRKDMFADEDTRSFGIGHSSTLHREGSEGNSAWSLRSMGALVRGVIGREPGASEADQGIHEWEKMDDHEEDRQGLIHRESLHSRSSSHPSRHQRRESFWSYSDPFEDRVPDDEYDHFNLRPGIPDRDADDEHSALRNDGTYDLEWPTLSPHESGWPFSIRSRLLTPLKEVSQISLSEPSNSITSLQTACGHADNTTLSLPFSVSPTCHSPTASRSPELHPASYAPGHSTTSGSTLSHSPSSTRPDSWWSRLTKAPLLDRRTSITSKPLDFRDPTPAPPLVLEEVEKVPDTVHSHDTAAEQPVTHGRTVSSAHSGRTANTDVAEHLGGSYDVVQRLASDGSSSRRAPSLGSAELTEQDTSGTDKDGRSEIAPSSSSSPVDPPRSTPPPSDCTLSTPSEVLSSAKSSSSTPKKGALVSSRIQAYERRLSQEIDSLQTPTPRNTRRREEVPSRTRPTIQYGVAPRASLFIANPDSERL